MGTSSTCMHVFQCDQVHVSAALVAGLTSSSEQHAEAIFLDHGASTLGQQMPGTSLARQVSASNNQCGGFHICCQAGSACLLVQGEQQAQQLLVQAPLWRQSVGSIRPRLAALLYANCHMGSCGVKGCWQYGCIYVSSSQWPTDDACCAGTADPVEVQTPQTSCQACQLSSSSACTQVSKAQACLQYAVPSASQPARLLRSSASSLPLLMRCSAEFTASLHCRAQFAAAENSYCSFLGSLTALRQATQHDGIIRKTNCQWLSVALPGKS